MAGFVGTSNLLTGTAAQKVLGRAGVFSVRPEKIRLDGPEPSTQEISTTGRVAEVIYAGSTTRFVVDLDAGERLVVVAQNQQTTSAEVAALRGRSVRLTWRSEHVVTVPAFPASEPAPR